MTDEKKGMKPIWYFVGWVLMLTGLVVVAAGFGDAKVPGSQPSMLAGLHSGLWWGALMVIVGGIYIITNRKSRIE